jgi:hypothetical protein
MRTAWTFVTMAAVTLALGACDGKKADECAALTTAANKDVAALKAAAAAKPASGAKDQAAAARATADAADKLVIDLAKKGPTVAELQKASGDYQAVGKSISTAARDYADALDHVAAMDAKMRPDAADADIKALTVDREKVKQRCADHAAPECRQIMALTANVATMPKRAEPFEKLESGLAEVKLNDKALMPLVATLRGSITGVAKTLRDAGDAAIELKSMDAKAKTASGALDAALAKEPPVTAGLATFCGGGGK